MSTPSNTTPTRWFQPARRRYRGAAARIGLCLGIALCAAAVSGTVAASAVHTNTRARFQTWAKLRASSLNGKVSTLTEIELDGQPGAEFVARVCRDNGWSETLLVERDGHRWEVPHTSLGHLRVCEAPTTTPPWRLEQNELLLTDASPGVVWRRRLVIVGSELVVASEHRAKQGGQQDVRWDLASQRKSRRQSRVVAVREGNRVAPEPGPVFVRQGESQWAGLTDADLWAVAERRANGSVILRINLRDDEHRLGLSGDRIQVWWTDPESGKLRGLDVRANADGSLRAIALRTTQPPPRVHGTIHDLEIALPWTTARASTATVPLTIVAYDVDTSGTTVLATSEFSGSANSLGLLRYVPGGGDYEIAGKRVGSASAVDDLPLPPT